jgi:superfamily II DNA or RNA helicase
MGDDSTERIVFSTCSGEEMLYKVTNLKDNTYYIVNESHILSLQSMDGMKYDIPVLHYFKMKADTKIDLYGYRVSITHGFHDRMNRLFEYVNCYGSTMVLESMVLVDEIQFLARSVGYMTYREGCKIRIIEEELLCPISVEPIGRGEYYGFVIGGNRRFLLADFTVVHNTTMAIHIMCQLKKKTLIVVHKDFLLQQWKQRILEFTNLTRIGILKAAKIDVEGHDVVIASLQSLSMKEYPTGLLSGFALCIFDEVHHTGAEVFSEALKKVNFRYSIGLSATPKRKDGLSKVFMWHIGDLVYNIKKRSDEVEVYIKEYFNTGCSEEVYMFNGKLNTARMINNICAFEPRIEYIIDMVMDILSEDAFRKILILSDRRAHIDAMIAMCVLRSIDAGTYYGGMKDTELKESEGKRVIIGSFQFSSEGLDIPGLNTLILASPKTDIIQVVGRILRDKPENRPCVPRIIDIVDRFSLFPNQAKKRWTYYKKCKYQIYGEEMFEEAESTSTGTGKPLFVLEG